jgi:hypothetical protein
MRYQTTTELTPRQALEQALADFGPGVVGLQITSQSNLSLVFPDSPDLVVKFQLVDLVDVISAAGLTTARRVSTGNQGLSCPQHMRAAVHH